MNYLFGNMCESKNYNIENIIKSERYMYDFLGGKGEQLAMGWYHTPISAGQVTPSDQFFLEL